MPHSDSRDRLVAVLLLVGVIGLWFFNPQAFIAEDSYFYLVIARNLAQTGEQTFNQLVGTNGVHPLWLYVLSLYSGLVHLLNPLLLYRAGVVVPLAGLMVAIGSALYWRIGRLLGLHPLLFAVIPLAYVSIFGILGSEGHLLYLGLALMLYALLRPAGRAQVIWVGLAGAIVLLARLDMVFVVLPLYLWLLSRWSWKRVLLAGVLMSVPVGFYLLSNLVTFGALTPISGWLKSSFPALSLSGIEVAGLGTNLSGYSVALGVLPLSISLIGTVWLYRTLNANTRILLPLVAGAICHALYIALFTTGFTTWVWYYVLPVMVCGLTVSLLINTYLPKQWNTWLARLGAAAALLLTGVNTVWYETPASADFALRYVQENDITESTLLVSEWPGRIAFFTTNRIIAPDMLTANRHFLADMLADANALRYLLAQAQAQGKPVAYIFSVGGEWLRPDETLTLLNYYHPRTLDQIVGTLTVGDPLMVNEGGIVWAAPPP
jgi:hypothetical protein